MEADRLAGLISEHKLAHHRKALVDMMRPAIWLRHARTAVGGAAGASRLGGEPDVPGGFAWPAWKGKPLAFIAQLRLSDMAAADKERALPPAGMLYFFYDMRDSTGGFDPADRGCARVLFHESEDGLSRVAAPGSLAPDARYRATWLGAQRGTSIPHEYSSDIEGLHLAVDDRTLFFALYDAFRKEAVPAGPDHQLLGHPCWAQSDMPLICQLASNGVACGGRLDTSPRAQALKPGAREWRLLFQVGTDDAADGPGWMWGDAGTIYYWIRAEALARRDFTDVWLVLDCA